MHKHVLSYTLSVNIYSIDNLNTKTNTQTYFKERKRCYKHKRQGEKKQNSKIIKVSTEISKYTNIFSNFRVVRVHF